MHSSNRPIVVVAAVIERQGLYLVTLRPPGGHLADHWEFPGGKCDSSETHTEALRRELHEELDIAATVGDIIFSVEHVYPERAVALHFYRCEFEGEPKPMLGQEIRWVARAELKHLRFPDADAELIQLLSK